MRKIFVFLVSILVIASCTDPFDKSSTENPEETVLPKNQIHYTTTDGNRLFPKSTEPSVFGAILVLNTYENGVGTLVFDGDVKNIGENAFKDCSALASITIPSGVANIGDGTFSGCSGLESITVSASITSIGNDAFNGCSSLKELRFENGEGTLSLGYKTNNSSSNGLFHDCPLETLYLGRDLLYKTSYDNGRSPFINNLMLKSVTISNSVTSIGDNAFYGCSNIKEVHVTDLVSWCNIDFKNSYSNPLFYAQNLYLNGKLVTNLVIPNSVTEINSRAFFGCSGLASVTIGEGVTSIGESAFYGCKGLKTVINFSNLIFSKGAWSNGCVAYYAENVMYGVEKDFLFKVVNGVNVLSEYIGCSANLVLPKNYKGEKYKIGERVFENCSNLISITIPNSVTSIGNGAFSGCTALKELRIEDGDWLYLGCNYYDDYYNSGQGLFHDCPLETLYVGRNLSYDSGSSFGYSPFNSKSTLTSVTVGNSVTRIGDYAFCDCSGFTKIIIGNSVKNIGDNAFYRCYGLTSVTIPNSVTKIGYNAFSACIGLTSIEIPNSVTSIGRYAFFYCSGLISITIPNSVTSIGDMAFCYCQSLKEVHITDLYAWYNISFGDWHANPLRNSNAKLYLNGVEVTDY